MAFSNLIDVAIINENENHYVSSLLRTFLIRCPIKPFRHGRSIIGNKTTPEKSFTASTGGAHEWSRHCFQNLFHLIHHRIKSLVDEASHLQFNKRQSLTSQMEEDGKLTTESIIGLNAQICVLKVNWNLFYCYTMDGGITSW
ncbi:hypothetical protein AVEN_766-1 [Araneus ventricosus]|uniref:Uncharacterized protein n=1 Tax=Araneus ventricosus TaxID=182803 RepID=A0A4Y2LBG3_ARAVE|nr:hypothetical protein AVEN_766-1 [Araneus ventricosus]